MKNTLTILAFLATCGLHGAIRKSEDARPLVKSAAVASELPAVKPPEKSASTPSDQPSAKPPEISPLKPADKKPDDTFMEELRKRAQANGGTLQMTGPELADLLRTTLEKQGVPKEQLKNAGLPQLMKLMQEKNPNALNGLGLAGPPMGPPVEKKVEIQLNDHFRELLEGHSHGATKGSPATFTLRDKKKPNDQIAFGTGVDADGWLLTKASEVMAAAELQCQVKSEWLAAKVVRVWEEHDLALVKVAAKDFPVAKWAEGTEPVIGSFITAAAPEGGEPVAIGVVSVATRNERHKGTGFLGVSLTSDEKGLKVRDVVPTGAAKASGMQKEDIILELDGKKPDSVFTFTRMVSEHKAGEKIRLKLQRGTTVMEKEIALGDRGAQPAPSRGSDKLASMGSTVNKRKGDFPSVLQTDLPLQASQCGGPVTDLDGNIIGLVIARSGRVNTMVLPSATIRKTLAGVSFATQSQVAISAPVASKPEAAKPSAAKPDAAKPEAAKPAPVSP